MSDDRDSFSNSAYYVGCDWRTYCHTYEDRPPIFSINAGRSAVSVSVKGRKADRAAVEFARAMALDAQLFAAEMERVSIEQNGAGDNHDQAEDGNAA
jgi:hypothetical protein